MYKEIIVQKYFCDCCGKEISGSVFSPVWGEFKLEDGENYNRDGDIINVDVCEACKDEAEKMIFGLFHPEEEAETEITENDKNSEESDENKQIPTENEEKPTPTGRKSDLDDDKILALRRAGWTIAKIADEMGVSQGTISKHLKDMNASAFVSSLEEGGEDE